MKTKKFGKKLTFNKATIVNLGNDEMNGLKGGTANPTLYMTGSPICCLSGPVTCISVVLCKI